MTVYFALSKNGKLCVSMGGRMISSSIYFIGLCSMRIREFIYLMMSAVVTGAVLSGCGDANGWKKIEVSQEKVSLTVQHFDRDLFALDTANAAAGDAAMQAKYGSFYQDYLVQMMGFSRADNPMDTHQLDPHAKLYAFIGNHDIRELYDTVQQAFPNTSALESELTDMLKHFQHYFPRKPHFKRVYTFITAFNYNVATYTDSIYCIGLDMYLGSHCHFYQSTEIPQFVISKMKPAYIVPNATEALYNLYFDYSAASAESPLIEALINEGRKYYFMECMLPETPDSMIIGYTSRQEEWCRNSEKSIWGYFNEHDLLYKVNAMEQKRYTADGPTTNGMPSDAPPKVGSWIGWQIVRRFMKNSKVSVEDLMTKYTAKQIFNMSNYKPK